MKKKGKTVFLFILRQCLLLQSRTMQFNHLEGVCGQVGQGHGGQVRSGEQHDIQQSIGSIGEGGRVDCDV